MIEAFKSTLDEICEADLLLHVIDVTHPACEEHMATVHKTLQEIGAAHIPTILVFNKIDQLAQENVDEATPFINMATLRKKYADQYGHDAVFISAKDQQNIPELKELLYQRVLEKHRLIYPNYLKSDHQEGA